MAIIITELYNMILMVNLNYLDRSLNCGQSSNQKINIYPNPNSNEFYISIFEIENKGKAIIEIVDLQGNVCFTENIQIADGVNVYAMNTDLSSGLYILRIIKDSIIFDSKNLIIR